MTDSFFNETMSTNKTYKTEPVSNSQFLTDIFGECLLDSRPMIVGFHGNPQNVSKSSWFGRAWEFGGELPSRQNAYFSLATYFPDNTGKFRRKKTNFSSLHSIMLDDVGTKVDIERIILKPSWVLETSPGNFQAGYILAQPLQDVVMADKLMKAVITAQLCDPGAGGPASRLARLPVGLNGKHIPEFQCDLLNYKPNLRYSVDDIVTGLDLDMRETGRPKRDKRKSKQISTVQEHDVFVPRPKENKVILALMDKQLYKGGIGEGKHDITCPWVHEHTDCVDGGTAYFEPNETYPIGGFKCLHGHCIDRNVRTLLNFLEIDVSSARMKPKIRCISGEIHRIVDQSEQELALTGTYFQRNGRIVVIATDPCTGEVFVKDAKQNSLVAALSSVAEWERYDKRSEIWTRIDPPTRVVSVLYDAIDYKHLPSLNGLTHQPYLRSDGSLVLKSGYDPVTGLYGVFEGEKFTIPEMSTKEQAMKALKTISELLSEFCFVDEIDFSATVSAILTAAIRPSLPLAPMFHVRAPQISSGKSFLCQLIGMFASPRRSAPASFPKEEEECQKMIFSELMRAPAVIEFDNLTTDLVAHRSLCTTLTSEFLTGRILGASQTTTVGTRSLFISSGNNVGPIHDMTRRCVTINLDPTCENPVSREFKNPNILSNLTEKRELYVSAALTIIRAWIVAGRPPTSGKPLASYGQWYDLCCRPLLWCGSKDPIRKVLNGVNEDPDRELLGRLLILWKDNFLNAPKMIRDVVNKAEKINQGDLYEVLNDIAGDRQSINRRVLGHWIKRHAGQIVNGMRFVSVSGSRSAAAWRVETISNKKTVPSVSSDFECYGGNVS